MKDKIAVLLTCFNRKEMTINCIKTIADGNPSIDFRFVVVDDNSSDGTPEALETLNYKIKIISGTGQLFWGGGMRMAMNYAAKSSEKYDYVMLVNDDVDFYNGAIEKLLNKLKESGADVIVGSCEDSEGNVSYGGVKMLSTKFARFKLIEPGSDEQCDTFNGNCVLMRKQAMLETGVIDSKLTHSMGDYDYGMRLRRKGFIVIPSEEFVGKCDDNSIEGTWLDKNVPRQERLKLKETVKGLPKDDWFHFLRKNYGIATAMYHSTTPYIKILIKK